LHQHNGPSLSPAAIAGLLAVLALVVLLVQHWPA
jgi:hypothetical protein